jgi:hypothetical protein
VVLFIKTMDKSTNLTSIVNLKTIHIKNKYVSQWLKVLGTKDAVKKIANPNRPWNLISKMECWPKMERCEIWKSL